MEDDYLNPECVEIPITGELDLHTFSPGELPDLLDDYISECRERGIMELRIVHGKGKGILRDRVWSLLRGRKDIESMAIAPIEAGGWGATLVRLRDSQKGDV